MNTDIRVSELADLNMHCSCGRTHRVPISHIITGKGVLSRLPEAVSDFAGKKVLLLGDTHTFPLAGDKVRSMLEDAGLRVETYIFSRHELYHTNETAIGELLVHMPQDTDLMVTVGSGTMNDITRAVCIRCRIPWIIVGTAPSMDGYASSTSAIISGDQKISVPLGSPYGIVTDTDLLITAPEEMLSSGIGDVLGKHVALIDWRLAAREGREHYCSEIFNLMEAACRRCQAGYKGVLARNPAAVGDMADTLVMSGAAISMFGTSRPAAGGEHQLAHTWEVAAISKIKGDPLHGNFVGLGTLAAIMLYQEASAEFDFSDLDYELPAPEEIEQIFRDAGGWALKERLGVTRELFYDAFDHAARTPRYSLLTYLLEKGRLEHYTRIVTQRMFD